MGKRHLKNDETSTKRSSRAILPERKRFGNLWMSKGLLWGCLMSNRAHLIIPAKENNVSDVLGDFKKFTSKKIIKAIKDHQGESRKECLPVGSRDA